MESSYILIITLLIFGVREIFCSPEPGLKRSPIVGAEEISIESVNYIVSVRKFLVTICGGSIIKPNIIITTAHCTYRACAGFLTVTSLQNNLNSESHRVVLISQHPSYSISKINATDYDVSLLKLKQPFDYNSQVHSIALVENQNFVSESMPLGIISSWTRTLEDGKYFIKYITLWHAEVRILTTAECESYVQSRYHMIGENVLCAGYKNGSIEACKADSSGSLVVGNKLVGIASFGEGCARANEFGVYTNIAQLRPWIDESIQYLEQRRNLFE